MKRLFCIITLTLPIGIFAQVQIQNMNYYNQADNDNNMVQMNIGNVQSNSTAQVHIQQQTTQGSFFGPENNNDKPCKDCDEVKQAVKASHVSSSARHHGKSFSIKQRARIFSGRMSIKMKKMFAHKYKAKTYYALCFNWH